jgi:hypothetical protein
MNNGKKWFEPRKGYGFIEPKDGEKLGPTTSYLIDRINHGSTAPVKTSAVPNKGPDSHTSFVQSISFEKLNRENKGR